jgi:glycosyltransferase involved in cell wall biosynthesis
MTMSQHYVVAVVCDTISPYSHGGRELRYQQLLPQLAERAEVHVYTMHWWDGPRDYSDGTITYHAISRLLPLYTDGRRSIRQALHFAFASLRLLRCHFDVLDADHMPYFHLFVLRMVTILKRKPFLVTWHEVWSRSDWCEYVGWTGWIAWSIEWLAMRLPDRIIAASPYTAERLGRTLGSGTSITTVPNGIDLNTIQSASPDAEVSDLVAVGRLLSHKHVDMLLDAVALLHARGTHITCRIIGDGPERGTLEERARALRIGHAVEFRHDVREQKELYALVKPAKVFVSLSVREGFGIAVLEAIACGIPVLTTSAPNNLAQHLVARYSRGVVCQPKVDAVADAAQKMLAEANGCHDAKYRTDSWVADYDWNAMADRIADAYLR